ncbi:MAG TPA: peptidylprolyl isomerase [Saprospiraceae bacterium]|nr:peptidylprolyl isomerase [Saprospiraceae bacterium]
MHKIIYSISQQCVIALLFICGACRSDKQQSVQWSQPVAEYKGKTFYLHQVQFPAVAQDEKDSLAMLSFATDQWLKEQILLDLESKSIKSMSSINELTESYKQSLILHEIEQQIMSRSVDSTITEEEYSKYYLSNKSEYRLESSLVRILFVKANKPIQDKKAFEKIWNTNSDENFIALQKFCANEANVCFLQSDKWIQWTELKQHIPSKHLNESGLSKGLQRSFADFNYEYYIKIIDVVKPNQDPPLSYVKEKAAKAILHTRQVKVLDSIKKTYYDQEMQNKQIKLFYQ